MSSSKRIVFPVLPEENPRTLLISPNLEHFCSPSVICSNIRHCDNGGRKKQLLFPLTHFRSNQTKHKTKPNRKITNTNKTIEKNSKPETLKQCSTARHSEPKTFSDNSETLVAPPPPPKKKKKKPRVFPEQSPTIGSKAIAKLGRIEPRRTYID